MHDVDYTAAVKLHNKYQASVHELYMQFLDEMKAAYNGFYHETTEGDLSEFFGIVYPTGEMQVYPDRPSEGATFFHESDTAIFYRLKVGDSTIIECIRKKVET